MPTHTDTAEHWLARAQEVRDVANTISDPAARQAMLAVAESYEKLAKRAEAREAGVPFTQQQKHNEQH